MIYIASFEESILLCNDYRHASAPARSESWGVVDVQVNITGLSIIRQQSSLDPRWGRSIRAFAMSSRSNSSKPRTSCGRVGLGLAGHGCLAPISVLEHGMRVGGRWDTLTDLRSERQLESEISLTEAAIATPLEISVNSKMLDSGRIVTPVA